MSSYARQGDSTSAASVRRPKARIARNDAPTLRFGTSLGNRLMRVRLTLDSSAPITQVTIEPHRSDPRTRSFTSSWPPAVSGPLHHTAAGAPLDRTWIPESIA